ncbi:sacsin N-terminal ATP-binding-like domain-containing protein [Salinarimonas sp. NSM]|uniref:sacsin N-terminal ATP-binding-like domain-containing protein n=1 Tax=Salinarimonas sp. NSM TaxID=3458003 RepID=UPI0040353F07
MPAYELDHSAAINAIRNDLKDRYRTRFTILKELIQNADDAQAGRFTLHLLARLDAEAENALLRGPGLLVVNDGVFESKHAKGIKHLSASSKTQDARSAGKFGLGQKAVFHLCDAFVVAPFGHAGDSAPFVVNPFLGIEAAAATTEAWDDVASDLARIERATRALGFPERALALWLPLRRRDLRPGERLTFAEPCFDAQEDRQRLMEDFLRDPGELALILAASRHLERLEIGCDGALALALDRAGGRQAALAEADGPDLSAREKSPDVRRAFSGAITRTWRGAAVGLPFAGLERLAYAEPKLRAIKSGESWPSRLTADAMPVPEKAEPHAATILVRTPADRPTLAISWGVFLPIGETDAIPLPVEGPEANTAYRLLLHGYFFVDAGRRGIDGFEASDDAPATVPVMWNRALRDRLLLPLLPRVLHDALEQGLVGPADLARIVEALVSHAWAERHGRAVCADAVLAEVWREPGGLAWDVLAPDARLRPLPASLLAGPDLAALLPGLGAFVADRDIAICAADLRGRARALLLPAPEWSPEELADLLALVPPSALKTPRLAGALVSLLELAGVASGTDPVGARLRALVRRAMGEEGSFAPADAMRMIVRRIPSGSVAYIPDRAAHRDILAALAAAAVDILVAREEWRADGAVSRLEDRGALLPLLQALESFVVDERDAARGTDAIVAAGRLIEASGRTLGALAKDPAFREVRLVPVTRHADQQRVSLSLAELDRAAEVDSIYLGVPPTQTNAKLLLPALPGLELYVAAGAHADLLATLRNRDWRLTTDAMVACVDRARRFGEPPARRALLKAIATDGALGPDRWGAVRRLAAGIAEAGDPHARVHVVEPALAPLLERVIVSSQNVFAAPRDVVGAIDEQDRPAIGLAPIDPETLERILLEALEAGRLALSPEDATALLEAPLSDTVLTVLPLHETEAGRFVALDETVCRATSRRVPDALRPVLKRVRPAASARARAQQERVVPPHDARAELRAALVGISKGLLDADALRGVVLDALCDLDEPLDGRLREPLRRLAWLRLGERLVPPQDVLHLPPAVDEACRRLLGRDDEASFHAAASLPAHMREHPGFARLQRDVLPSEAASVGALALQIEALGVIGLPVAWEATTARDLGTLAAHGVDLHLPGWPLARALMDGPEAVVDGRAAVLQSLLAVETFEDLDAAAETMAVLTRAAAQTGQAAEAARRCYRRLFDALAGLPDGQQRRLFTHIDVPTRDGSWRSGRVVAARGHGLAPSCILDEGFAGALATASDAADRPESGTDRDQPGVVDAHVHGSLDRRSAESFANFLERLRGRLPPELALTLLALAGRSEPMREAMRAWTGQSISGVDDHVGRIDTALAPALSGFRLDEEIAARRIVLEPALEAVSRQIALSGELFDAPIGDDTALVVGAGHEKGAPVRGPDGTCLRLHVVQVQARALEGRSAKEVIEAVRGLVRVVADECLALHMDVQRAVVDRLPGMQGGPSQDLVEHTQAALREALPTLLQQIKPKADAVIGPLVARYEAAKRRRLLASGKPDPGARSRSERELWDALVQLPEAQASLLALVRHRLQEFGYDPSRAVFELFQNADDATRQRDGDEAPRTFRLEASASGFEAVHWGRPINERGRDREAGERLGHHRDLENMLMLHGSDKPGERSTTGKYGLGFKVVHALASEVRLASALVGVRIVGGMLPLQWPEGAAAAARHRREDAEATLVRLDFDADAVANGREAVADFAGAAPWLPLFAKAVRRVEIVEEERSVSFERADVERPLAGVPGACVVSVTGDRAYDALMLDLEDGFRMAVSLGESGPVRFPDGPRLWWTAPLEHAVASGWMIDGPFRLSPNRTALADDPEDREEAFGRMGRALGRRLTDLVRATSDWTSFCAQIGRDPGETTRTRFLERLWGLFRVDLDDPLAEYLHRDGRGLAALAAEFPIAPTGVPAPFAQHVRLGDTMVEAVGALADGGLLRTLAGLEIAAGLPPLVSRAAAHDLRGLGAALQPLGMAGLINRVLGAEARVSPAVAAELGALVDPSALMKPPLQVEYSEVLAAARRAHLRDRSGGWRRAADLVAPRSGDDAENLRARFAPPDRVLDDSYDRDALGFVLIARAGYGPNGDTLRGWASAAQSADAREAVLAYAVDHDDRDDFKNALLRDPPHWMRPLDALADTSLTSLWMRERRDKLRAKLTDYSRAPAAAQFDELIGPFENAPAASAEECLGAIWDWWEENRAALVRRYEERTYPHDLAPASLPRVAGPASLAERERWFSFLALACFQGFGGAQDGQHGSFLRLAAREGWWSEIGHADAPEDPTVWHRRLRAWSGTEEVDLSHWRWRRTLIDLYKIGRWLPTYAWIATVFPRAVRSTGPVSLSNVLTPSYSPIFREAGIEAAPLVRTLGLGANWMFRELGRTGFWSAEERAAAAPYGWAGTARVRKLLNRLGALLEDKADMDMSPAIWQFVSQRLGDRADVLLRDGDLPLQTITRKEFEGDLAGCLRGDPDDEPWDFVIEDDEGEGVAEESLA